VDCTGSTLSIIKLDKGLSTVHSGEVVPFAVYVGIGTQNMGCDNTDITVTFTKPDINGNPSGETVVLGTGLSFPADGTGDRCYSESAAGKKLCPSGITNVTVPGMDWTVNVNPGVTKAIVNALLSCPTSHCVHDVEGPGDTLGDSKYVSVDILMLTPTPTPCPTPTPTPAPTPFIFPSCESLLPTPGDKAHYPTGLHQIVGGSLTEGSDDVYSLDQNNFVQCFCPSDGDQGIQSNWLRQDESIDGWFFLNGTQWDLGDLNYAVQNLSFNCQATPTPTPTPTPTISPTPMPASTPTPTPTVSPAPTPTPIITIGGGGCAGSCGSAFIASGPRISVTKNSTPYVLPIGGGIVIYGYQVFNPGSGFLTDVVLADDKCNPVVFTGGDLNNDAKLDNGEIWTYTCQADLNETTINTATATGNFGTEVLTATATSTVIVGGAQGIDLSIKVQKKATPALIAANSGQVLYSYDVTNPGTLTLQDVTLTDDKCGPVNFISGDFNSDGMLETGETWKYTCEALLLSTTTNTATARGQSAGRYVTDVTSDTVFVGKDVRNSIVIPKSLPKTGGGGAASDLGWNWLLPPFVFLGLVMSRKKSI